MNQNCQKIYQRVDAAILASNMKFRNRKVRYNLKKVSIYNCAPQEGIGI